MTPSTPAFVDPEFQALRRHVTPHIFEDEGWRSHGLGMAQKYIGDDLRLHVWDPTLTGFEEDELTHCHRCAMVSHVLHGVLHHTEVLLGPDGEWAKASFTTHPDRVDVKVEDRVSIEAEHPCLLSEGMFYTFPAQTYHRATTKGLVVTLVELGPKTGPSFALFPPGSTPRHAHGQVPEGAVGEVLKAVRTAVHEWEV